MKKILSVILAAALLISLSAPVFAEDKLPTKWDLTVIYPSAEEWQKDYDKVMDMLNEYERFRGTLNNAQGIWDYLQFAYFTELTRLQNKLVEYAFLGSSLDATDPVFAEMNARLSTMNTREGQLTAFAIPEIYSLPLEEREAIFADPLFQDCDAFHGPGISGGGLSAHGLCGDALPEDHHARRHGAGSERPDL